MATTITTTTTTTITITTTTMATKPKETEIEDSERLRKSTAEDKQQQARGRLEVGARSRSRGRTPAELLARRQQLLSGQSSPNISNSETSTSSRISNGYQDHPRQQQRQDESSYSSAWPTNQMQAQLSAEAKLESLSVLLKNHQVSSSSSSSQDQDTSPSGSNQAELNSPTMPNGAGTAAAAAPGQLKSIDDVYILLAKKEKDLQLAAELGKVLLERNEELSRANEKITEEYSHKLEVSRCCGSSRLPEVRWRARLG